MGLSLNQNLDRKKKVEMEGTSARESFWISITLIGIAFFCLLFYIGIWYWGYSTGKNKAIHKIEASHAKEAVP